MKNNLSVFTNIKKLKTLLLLSVLTITLAGNARAQDRKPVSKNVKDKIIKNINSTRGSWSKIKKGSVEIVPDDGFIKVEYIYAYPGFDGNQTQNTQREIYTENGKELRIVGTIATAKYVRRIRKFPKKTEKLLSDYIVLGLEKKKDDGGHTVYNAYDTDGNLVTHAYSLKELYTKISEINASETKGEPVVKKNKKRFRNVVPHIPQGYTR